MEALNLKIVLIFTLGFGIATLFGYLSQLLKLSPILGYLIAGYIIGPFSPGFVADIKLAEELASIGVVLMMFGAGLHFRWKDLVRTAKISIPGALVQTAATTCVAAYVFHLYGAPLESGIIFGLAIGVASTVVLIRVLSDNHLMNTTQGHIAVGWLIVEDLITVLVLILVPSLAPSQFKNEIPYTALTFTFGWTLIKTLIFAYFMFTVGRKVILFCLTKLDDLKNDELFTIAVVSITFLIAAGSTYLLGTSMVLGAFIAGMIMGETDIHHHVSRNVNSLKDLFVVMFFLSIGMLFDPSAIVDHPLLFLSTLAIILIIKPLAAFLIAFLFKYKTKVSLTIAIGLAQIGEFSFILAEQANAVDLLPNFAYDMIVACAIVSISLNPLLFKILKKSYSSENSSGIVS